MGTIAAFPEVLGKQHIRCDLLWHSWGQLSEIWELVVAAGEMLPSPEFSHLPLFPSHPLQTSLSPTIPISIGCQRRAISRLLHLQGRWVEDDHSTGTAVSSLLGEQSNSFEGNRCHQQSSNLKGGFWTCAEDVDSCSFRGGGMKNRVSFQGLWKLGAEGGHSPDEAVPQQYIPLSVPSSGRNKVMSWVQGQPRKSEQ